jgi:hypothetical protein
MKKFILLSLLVSSSVWAQDVPDATMARLQRLYPDQSVEFLTERLKNAPNAFDKWRSFPPYYYELIQRSVKNEDLKARRGMCAGDPHLENFGFISGLAEPIFTINDLDDVTACSLNADLMRLFIAQRLINPSITSDKFLANYGTGLNGSECVQPKFIKKLAKDAVKKGKDLSKKNKAMLEAKTCSGDYQELTSEEKKMLESFVKAENGDKSCLSSDVLSPELRSLAKSVVNADPKEIIHACSRIKQSGGSAGGKRFLVFRQSAAGVVDAFELKPLVKSASDYHIKVSAQNRKAQFEKAVETYLSPELKAHYYPVTLNKVLYQRRPVWGGNEEVKAEDIAAEDQEGVMLFETCTLGKLHSKSKAGPLALDAKAWQSLAESIEQQFKAEFQK